MSSRCRLSHYGSGLVRQRLSGWVVFLTVQFMWGRKVCILKLDNGKVPAGGVLVGDGSNGRFGFDI